MIEITINRTTLRRCLVIVSLGFLLFLGVIGAAISPLVNGHPVILTREHLALKHYLEEAQGWIQRFDDIAARLDTLSPGLMAIDDNVVTNSSAISLTQIPTGTLSAQVDLPSQAPLSSYNAPVSQPTNIFDRAHAAEQVIQDLQMLEHDLQQVETPVAFNGLQDIATGTMQTFATWSSQVMNVIGAPTSHAITATETARQAALLTLNNLRRAVARQQGTQP